MNDWSWCLLPIGKTLMFCGLAAMLAIYLLVSLDLMTKQQEEFSRRHKKHLARQKQKATNQLIRARVSDLVMSIVAALGPNQVADLATLRKACKAEMKRYAREADQQREGEKSRR
jgi:hypothetical protein